MEQKQPLQQMVLGHLDSYVQKKMKQQKEKSGKKIPLGRAQEK